jgi:hypothetical protein
LTRETTGPVVNRSLINVIFSSLLQYCYSLSGGDDGLHGNQTIMEGAFNGGLADWEITRYSGVGHGYTAFSSGAYNLVADARSWESMLTSFEELMAVPRIMDTPAPSMDSGGSSQFVDPSEPTSAPEPEASEPTPAPAPSMYSGASSLGLLFVVLGSAAVALLLA